MYSWIDNILIGLTETYNTSDIYELYDYLNITIIKLNFDNPLLKSNEAFYYRDYFENEVVLIRNDLDRLYEKFILAHELAHAILHTETYEAVFNKDLLNLGKFEKQANYFATKLLNLDPDSIECDYLTIQQIASCLEVPENALRQLVNL